MNRLLLALPLALIAVTPAHATSGLFCSTAGADPIELQLVIGHAALPTVVQARLRHGERDVPVTVAQSWLEPNEVRVDLTDPEAARHELRLRVRARGDAYDGSLWRLGKRRWVRCRES